MEGARVKEKSNIIKKIAVAVTAIVAMSVMFLFFWNSTFSIKSAEDKWYFIGFGCLFVVVAILFIEMKKPILYYGLAVFMCIGTLVSLFMYKNWNAEGYYIDVEDVERIIYNEEIVGSFCGNQFGRDYTDKKVDIVTEFNSADCIKNWNGQGDIGTTLNYIEFQLKDGSDVRIYKNGQVYMDDVVFMTNLTFEDILE